VSPLLRREISIVFGARVTWVVSAIAALLVGHGFVLALDLYAAASRSALDHVLMQRELDPLAGIIRPTLGGLHLAVALLVPVVAARGLGIEKERHGYGALALRVCGTDRVVAAKLCAAGAAALAMLLPPLACIALFAAIGGHVDAIETAIAISGHALHALVVASASVAAAAGTRTVAQATTLGISMSLASWAIDAGEGFAALAWMVSFSSLSMGGRLAPFEQGIVAVGSLGWLLALVGLFVALAFVLARIGPARRRAAEAIAVVAIGLSLVALLGGIRPAYDWSETRRASLPPAAVRSLRAMPQPIAIELWLDHDDGRRVQVERDVLAKLRLARPDVRIEAPLDDRELATIAERDEDYGRIVIRVGEVERQTRSTSRKEITTLVFEAAGLPLPEWAQSSYPGYPLVVEPDARACIVALAYLGFPLGVLGLGLFHTRRRRRMQ
jgi:hypothetical protein